MAAAAAWASCVYANAWSIARVSGACSVKASAAACRHTGSEDSGGRYERNRARASTEPFYGMALNPREIVDATRKGNLARFINHSCAPNLEVVKWNDALGWPRLGLFAKRPVKRSD